METSKSSRRDTGNFSTLNNEGPLCVLVCAEPERESGQRDRRGRGELPIGAVVVIGDDIVGSAHTQEIARRRRLVHADLLAMIAADEALGMRRRPHPVRLAVNLEPCVPRLHGGIRRGDVRDQFRRYCETSPPSAYRRWSKTLVDLPA